MKIAQVAPFLPERPGGSAVYSSNLAVQLEKRGHEVQFFAPNFPPNGHRNHIGTRIPLRTSRCFGLALGVNPLTFLTGALAKTDADILHAHSYIYTTSNQAALASRISGKPFVLHIHGATFSRTEHLDRRTSTALFLKERVYDPTVGRWTIESADAIAAVSEYDLRQCREVFDVDEDKLHLIPNAVDPEEFHPPAEEPASPPVVTYIGRLERWKGAESLAEIARLVHREVPEAIFQVVGTGSLLDQVRAETAELNGTMRFLGETPHESIAAILRGTSVLVLPSLIEGLPTVCLEALASGVPVVASSAGGTPEVVVDGETGFICSPHDLPRFADRVVALLRDPALRRRLGRNGRALVERHHSWSQVAEMTEKLYMQLV